MPEPRAQRTLVKSPPELWAELSDLEALARHLGEFGEIRITRLEPETTVAWEGDRACGTVELEPAGWGTKVTITAQLAAAEAPTVAIEAVPAEPEPLAVEPEAETPGQGAEEETPEPVAVEPERVAVEPEPIEPEPAASEPIPEPRVGFFARLFGRRRDERVVAEPELVAEREAVAVEPEPLTAAEQQPVVVAVAEPEPDAEPEPVAVAQPEPEREAPASSAPLDDHRAHEILTGVLDDLGSAHHRPFSRG
jgi:hypothetical protein